MSFQQFNYLANIIKNLNINKIQKNKNYIKTKKFFE